MDLKGLIPIMIKDTSTSQEHPASSKPPAMSYIFEIVPLQGILAIRSGAPQVTPGRMTKEEEEAQDHKPIEAVHRVVA